MVLVDAIVWLESSYPVLSLESQIAHNCPNTFCMFVQVKSECFGIDRVEMVLCSKMTVLCSKMTDFICVPKWPILCVPKWPWYQSQSMVSTCSKFTNSRIHQLAWLHWQKHWRHVEILKHPSISWTLSPVDVSCCLPSPEPGPAARPWPMAAARTAPCGCRRWRAPNGRPLAPGDGGRTRWRVRAGWGWDGWDGDGGYFHGSIWDFNGILWEFCGSWWDVRHVLEFGYGWLIVERFDSRMHATITLEMSQFPALS